MPVKTTFLLSVGTEIEEYTLEFADQISCDQFASAILKRIEAVAYNDGFVNIYSDNNGKSIYCRASTIMYIKTSSKNKKEKRRWKL